MKGSQLLPHASGIYKITNLLNGKVYIGQSKDIYVRYNQHHKYEYKNESRADFHLYQAFKKYGLDNFSIEVVELCPQNELNDKEIYWIEYYDSFKQGYNMTAGGSNLSPSIHSAEVEQKRKQTREKTQALVGENHPRAKLTNEEVLNIRQRYSMGENIQSIYQDYKNIYENIGTFQQIVLGKHYSEVGNIPTALEKKMANSKFTAEDIIEMRRLYYTENITQAALARQYNISQSSVKDIVNRVSYKEVIDNIPNQRIRKSYRLTAEQVRDIRAKAAAGVSIQSLSSEYCIDTTAIRKCVNRQTYKNVE